jgi:hypothetical protein
MPGNKCSNCAAYNFDCKYEEAAKKRGPPKGYVESLESRLEKMESLLQRVRRPVGLVSVTFSSYLAVSRRRLYARTRSAD